MAVTDVISDMLTRIRNAINAKHTTVDIPTSKVKVAIAQILKDEGYIADFAEKGEGVEKQIAITLKLDSKGKYVITGLKRISKPGLRIYASVDKLPKVINGLGIAIISTSKGIMTDKQARTQCVGGEVLAYVW
ncbi:MAG: 30S ribosomal protein S8 [Clostridia bacterium]|nr:30S ribosomal protein S8 [Clostridia bacterium]